MKICANCKRVLSDDETTCPYCASADLEAKPEGDALLSSVLYDQSTIELPAGEIEAALEAVDTELSDNYDFPAEEPEESAPERKKADDAGARGGEAEQPGPRSTAPAPPVVNRFEDSGGELEARVRDIAKAEGALDESDAPRKLGITLIALLIIAVLVFAVVCLVKYMKAPVASDSEILLDYISGQWLSEPFVYADDLSHGYVEILVIDKDGTFTLTHLIPDARNENGYKDGSWPVDYRISGTLEVYADEKCALFKYSEFGKDYYLDRYIVRMEDEALTLREYYDDDNTESFDMVYRRIGAGGETGSADAGSTETTQQAQQNQ